MVFRKKCFHCHITCVILVLFVQISLIAQEERETTPLEITPGDRLRPDRLPNSEFIYIDPRVDANEKPPDTEFSTQRPQIYSDNVPLSPENKKSEDIGVKPNDIGVPPSSINTDAREDEIIDDSVRPSGDISTPPKKLENYEDVLANEDKYDPFDTSPSTASANPPVNVDDYGIEEEPFPNEGSPSIASTYQPEQVEDYGTRIRVSDARESSPSTASASPPKLVEDYGIEEEPFPNEGSPSIASTYQPEQVEDYGTRIRVSDARESSPSTASANPPKQVEDYGTRIKVSDARESSPSTASANPPELVEDYGTRIKVSDARESSPSISSATPPEQVEDYGTRIRVSDARESSPSTAASNLPDQIQEYLSTIEESEGPSTASASPPEQYEGYEAKDSNNPSTSIVVPPRFVDEGLVVEKTVPRYPPNIISEEETSPDLLGTTPDYVQIDEETRPTESFDRPTDPQFTSESPNLEYVVVPKKGNLIPEEPELEKMPIAETKKEPVKFEKIEYLSSLGSNRFVQVISSEEPQLLEEIAKQPIFNKVRSKNLLRIHKRNDTPYYNLLIGPFQHEKIGVELLYWRGQGYSDAFVRYKK